jgi:hypothetical protein
MEWPRAEDLLAGPRGRRLCWSLLEPGDYPGWDLVWDGAQQGSLTGLTAELATCVARTDLESTVVHADQLTLLPPWWSRCRPRCTGKSPTMTTTP